MPKRKLLVFLCLFLAACQSVPQKQTTAAPKQDLLAADIDATVSPADDFFEYANGGWIKRNPIPASEPAWGIGNVVREELYGQLRKIDEAATQKKAPTGTDEQKIGDFWTTAMDESKAEQLRLMPLKPELDRINGIKTVQDALDVAFTLQPLGVEAFFNFFITQDEKNSEAMAVHLYQGGLGLPDRDFYFNKEEGVARIRKEYGTHLNNMLKLAGSDDAAASAAASGIMEFETALAKVSRKLEDLRDPQKNYNKMTVDDVTRQRTPSIDWKNRLNGWTLQPSFVVVGQPEFFSGLESL